MASGIQVEPVELVLCYTPYCLAGQKGHIVLFTYVWGGKFHQVLMKPEMPLKQAGVQMSSVFFNPSSSDRFDGYRMLISGPPRMLVLVTW